MTKVRLRAYKHIRQERDDLKKLLDDLDEVIYGPGGQRLDGMPRSGSAGQSQTERQGDRHMALHEKYERKVADLTRQMAEIEEAIETLLPLERSIIRLHYFQGLTWDEVAERVNYSRRQVTRLHGWVLIKLQREGEDKEKCD